MSAISDYLEEAAMNHLFNAATLTPPETHVALFTATPTDTGGGTEVSGGAYARVRVFPVGGTETVLWAAAAATTTKFGVKNADTINYPTATAAWGDVKALGIFDHATTGNQLWQGTLDVTKTVGVGDGFKFPPSNLTATLE